MKIVVSCAMGLETVLKYELIDLGYSHVVADNGMVSFDGQINDIIELNLWSRVGGRVFIERAPFEATSFDDLFDAIYGMDWSSFIPINGRCTIDSVSTKNSVLFAQSAIQSIAKKAILNSLKKSSPDLTFNEDGPHIPIRIVIQKNMVNIRLDTTGHGLNKRGYRSRFEAPLRETLAAAMIKLSRWNPEKDVLLDPFCGSGTILIEAAMIASNLAPGLNQSFCSESWPLFKKNEWKNARERAKQAVSTAIPRIYGSDINPNILKTARINIKNIGLNHVFVEKKDIKHIQSRFKFGKIICNPPYGVRLNDQPSIHQLYKTMGLVFKQNFPKWDYYILSGNPLFETHFNQIPNKKRKLFNGNIRCDLLQFFNGA